MPALLHTKGDPARQPMDYKKIKYDTKLYIAKDVLLTPSWFSDEYINAFEESRVGVVFTYQYFIVT